MKTLIRCAFLALAIACVPVLAPAQVAVRASLGGAGAGPSAGKISKPAMERYARTLKLDDAQKEAAGQLHAAFSETWGAAQKEANEQMKALQEDADPSEMGEVFKKMPEIFTKSATKQAAATKQFLDDLRSLLTPDQERQWPTLERLRRRESGLTMYAMPFGSVSGAKLDLVQLIDGLKMPADEMAKASSAIEAYEVELDRVLADNQKSAEEFAAEQQKKTPKPEGGDAPMAFDMESAKAQMTMMRQQAIRVRDLNQKHVRAIGSGLSDAWRAKLDAEFRTRSFRQVYKESYATRALGAAEKFADLTDDQRKLIAELKAEYQREAPALNDRWASEQEKADTEGKAGGMSFFGTGEEEPSALADARKARRELDRSVEKRLKGALGEAQKPRLPKKQPEGMFNFGGGDDEEGGEEGEGAVIIRMGVPADE